jgi:hypothetical protein
VPLPLAVAERHLKKMRIFMKRMLTNNFRKMRTTIRLASIRLFWRTRTWMRTMMMPPLNNAESRLLELQLPVQPPVGKYPNRLLLLDGLLEEILDPAQQRLGNVTELRRAMVRTSTTK